MTLHWWMHWFWVTMHVAVTLTSPMPSLAPVSTNATTENPAYKNTSLNISQTTEILAEIQRNYRGAKSVNLQVPTLPLPLTNLTTENVNNNETADELRNIITTIASSSSSISSSLKTTTLNYSEDLENNTVGPKKDIRTNKITIKPLRPKSQEIPSHEAEIMAVIPLQSVEEAKPKSLGNMETTNWSQSQINWTDSMTSESVATVTSLLDGGSSDATRLGRARGTFSNELQRNQISGDDRIRHNNNNNSNNVIKDSHESNTSATEIAAITGSCLAMVILLSTVGSLGFIMYRRKYLNPPQTLNSDKCSNPDSSGYIDDSTIRENSEEMYSLDNDSFLNSLEAMTIQNYWTDSVKHTKL